MHPNYQEPPDWLVITKYKKPHKIDMEILADKIRNYRIRNHISAVQFAEQIGVSAVVVKNWEDGKTKMIKPDNAIKLMSLLPGAVV